MKSAPGGHRQDARAANVVVRLELAGFEDHLQVSISARFLDGDDLIEDVAVVALQERATVDDHVDLVGARRDGLTSLEQLDIRVGLIPTGSPWLRSRP